MFVVLSEAARMVAAHPAAESFCFSLAGRLLPGAVKVLWRRYRRRESVEPPAPGVRTRPGFEVRFRSR